MKGEERLWKHSLLFFVMDSKKLSVILVILLAVIAAIVATGLIAGYSMWAFIVGYWCVLTMKNALDYISINKKEERNVCDHSEEKSSSHE